MRRLPKVTLPLNETQVGKITFFCHLFAAIFAHGNAYPPLGFLFRISERYYCPGASGEEVRLLRGSAGHEHEDTFGFGVVNTTSRACVAKRSPTRFIGSNSKDRHPTAAPNT